jgi:hypothetical protein
VHYVSTVLLSLVVEVYLEENLTSDQVINDAKFKC